MTIATREAPHHDNLTCVTEYNCRLPACLERRRTWGRNRWRAMAAGTWQPLVDAEPARAHLRIILSRGVTLYRAAQLAGVDYRAIWRLCQHRPRQHTIRAEHAEKILAIDPAAAVPAHVDGTGTLRRIQALVAAGWPMRQLEPRLGLGHNVVHQIVKRVQGGRPILATTAAKVADGYEELKGRRPERDGVPMQGVRQVRTRARKQNWAPPKYWDTLPGAIDDPDFTPEYGKSRQDILAEDALWLIRTQGYDRAQAAERLGVKRGTLDTAIARWRLTQNDTEQAA